MSRSEITSSAIAGLLSLGEGAQLSFDPVDLLMQPFYAFVHFLKGLSASGCVLLHAIRRSQ
jgi:hypothetical protein